MTFWEKSHRSKIFATWVFSPKKFHFCLKNFGPQNKKRTKTTRHTMYFSMSSIPSGGPPGVTHTQELWYSLRGIDAELQSVSSKDKCPCDACCSRFSTPIFVPFFSYFVPQNFISAKTKIFRRKNPCRFFFLNFFHQTCQREFLYNRHKIILRAHTSKRERERESTTTTTTTPPQHHTTREAILLHRKSELKTKKWEESKSDARAI